MLRGWKIPHFIFLLTCPNKRVWICLSGTSTPCIWGCRAAGTETPSGATTTGAWCSRTQTSACCVCSSPSWRAPLSWCCSSASWSTPARCCPFRVSDPECRSKTAPSWSTLLTQESHPHWQILIGFSCAKWWNNYRISSEAFRSGELVLGFSRSDYHHII